MIIGIGTENAPKIAACKAVLKRIYKKLGLPVDIRFISQSTFSGIPDMPLNQTDMMTGAQNRALNLYHTLYKQNKKDIAYTIGLEGGLFSVNSNTKTQPDYFLQSWVYVFDGSKGFWGSSGAVTVPEKIYLPIVNQGLELADVMDKAMGAKNIRSKMGAVGIFTQGLVDRQEFFEKALTFAFAPFYNKDIYG